MDTGKTYGKRPVNSIEQSRLPGLDGFGLFDFKPLRQPPDLLFRQQQSFRFVPWPSEYAVVQTLIQQEEPVPFP